jgi:hypothetical protein
MGEDKKTVYEIDSFNNDYSEVVLKNLSTSTCQQYSAEDLKSFTPCVKLNPSTGTPIYIPMHKMCYTFF